MSAFKTILFYFCLIFLPLGIIFRNQDITGGSLLYALGTFGIIIYYIASLIKDLIFKRGNKYSFILKLLLIFTIIVLFSKYLYHFFGDYIGLAIIPIFLIYSFFYFLKNKPSFSKEFGTSILFYFLIIPLFFFSFYMSPRKFIPQDWYNRFDPESDIAIELPFDFKTQKVKDMHNSAKVYKDYMNFDEVSKIYTKALEIEPKNPRIYFELSESQANDNKLDEAILSITKAIELDSTYFGFYNNRGLIYYKLKENELAKLDFLKAITLNQKFGLPYANLGLTYYYLNQKEKACQSFNKAEELGFKIDNYQETKDIKERSCE
jgi:tetratricopeptide (TPR) repeat protein